MPDEHGVALIITLLVMMLLSILGLSLALVTMTEVQLASSFRDRREAFYAADAMLQHVAAELALLPDWSPAVAGTVTSSFVQPAGRAWPDELAATATAATSRLNCGNSSCTDADMDQRTQERPWGPNNPRWQLFAYGPLAGLSASGSLQSRVYVAAWVADDALENDDQPLVDGDSSRGPNPGRGVIEVLVQAYGVSRQRQVIEATLSRTPRGVRVLSWRVVR